MRLLLACAVLLCGCDGFSDFVDDPLGDFQLQLQVTDARIDLGDAVRVPVFPGEPRLIESVVTPGLDIRSVDEIQAITLLPAAFSFEAPRPASGTVRALLAVDGYPVPGTPVTVEITDGAVTAVTPSRIATAESRLDAAEVAAFLARLPADERPALADYASLTVDEVRERLQAALGAPDVRVTLGVEVASSSPERPLVGVLGVSSFLLSGVVTR